MNIYESIIDLWSIHQIVPNDQLRDAILTLANTTFPRQLRHLHTFFYQHNDPIQEDCLTLIKKRIYDLEDQIQYDLTINLPLLKKDADKLDEMILYYDHLNEFCATTDRTYIQSLRRVIEHTLPAISWKRYKKYLEFLRKNDATFLPRLEISRFYSDQNKILENIDYSTWIGEHYPLLFNLAVRRIRAICWNITNSSMPRMRIYHPQEGGNNNYEYFEYVNYHRMITTIIIDENHLVAPIEVNVQNSFHDNLMLVLNEIFCYALLLSGQDAECSPQFNTRLLMDPAYITRPNAYGCNMSMIKKAEHQCRQVLYMLRHISLEDHLRLITQMSVMSGRWLSYEQSLEDAMLNNPCWSFPDERLLPFLNDFKFLNRYMTWINLVRESTIYKNKIIGFTNAKDKPIARILIPGLFDLIISYLHSYDKSLLPPAMDPAPFILDLYHRYRKEQPTFKENFSEWLAPQRHLASNNMFAMFSGRQYSPAGQQELWEPKSISYTV